jgi:ATP-binding cassette subfamily C (CFTR/MRP) protein 10
LLISPLNAFPWVINGLVEAHVSIKRVQRFINTEPTYLDEYYENSSIDPQLSLGIPFASSSSLFN